MRHVLQLQNAGAKATNTYPAPSNRQRLRCNPHQASIQHVRIRPVTARTAFHTENISDPGQRPRAKDQSPRGILIIWPIPKPSTYEIAQRGYLSFASVMY